MNIKRIPRHRMAPLLSPSGRSARWTLVAAIIAGATALRAQTTPTDVNALNLSASGNTTLGGNLSVAGATILNTLDVSSAAHAASFSVDGALQIGGATGNSLLINHNFPAAGVAYRAPATGGWSRGFNFLGPDNAILGGIGGKGSGYTLERLWLGANWDQSWMDVSPSGTNIGGSITGQGSKHIVSAPWYHAGDLTTGYIKLVTPILKNEGNMFTIRVTGFRYGFGSDAITIQANGYAYIGQPSMPSGGLIQDRCETHGTDLPVEMGVETRGGQDVVVIRIGTPTTTWYAPQFTFEYRGWNAKKPEDFAWVSGEATPVQAGNTNNTVIANTSGPSWFNAGRVGIGTTVPNHLFDVANVVGIATYGELSLGANRLVIGAGGISPNSGSIAWGDDSGWKLNFGTKKNGAFAPRVTFVDTGKVGIGITDPNEALEVAGNIKADGLVIGSEVFGLPSEYVKTTGAAVVGNLTATGGTVTGGSTGLAIRAGGEGSQNITISPTGAGSTIFDGRVMTENAGTALGEVFAGNTVGGAELYRAMRIGQSRVAGADDALISKNLGPKLGTNNYQTYANEAFGGMEFRYVDGNSQDIYFYASGMKQSPGAEFTPVPRLVIRGASGNVGIGTPTPGELLSLRKDEGGHVVDILSLTNLAAVQNIQGSGSRIVWNGFYGNQAAIKGVVSPGDGSFDNEGDLVFQTATNSVLSDKMTIKYNGNVGIGTNNPYHTLDVAGNVGIASYGEISQDFANKLLIGGGGLSPNSGSIAWGDNTGWKLNLGTRQGGTFAPRVTFMDTGEVGIGTTSPNVKLEVAGTGRFTGQGGFSIGNDAGQNRIESSTSGFAFRSSANAYHAISAKALSIGATYGDTAAPVNGAIIEGDVGIGTSPVGAKLHVNGNVKIESTLSAGATTVGTLSAGATTVSTLSAGNSNLAQVAISGNSTFDGGLAFQSTTGNTTSNAGGLSWGNAASDPLKLVAGSGRSLFLSGNTATGLTVDSRGYVGIGTPGAPESKLDIFNSSAEYLKLSDVPWGMRLGALQAGQQFISLGVKKTAVNDVYVAATGDNAAVNHLVFEMSHLNSGGGFNFLGKSHVADGTALSLTNLMHIDVGGNVGIGTGVTAPAAKLDVVGDGKFSTNLLVGGNVGIGTESVPGNKLEVVGNVKVNGNLEGTGTGTYYNGVTVGGTSTTQWSIGSSSFGTLSISRPSMSQTSLSLDSGGNATFNGQATFNSVVRLGSSGPSLSSTSTNFNGQRIQGLANPVADGDAANRGYVNSNIPFEWPSSGTKAYSKGGINRFGLGTTDPEVPLHTRLSTTDGEVARFGPSGDTTKRSFIRLENQNPAFWWEFSVQDKDGGGATNGFALRSRNGGGNSVERLFIADSGKVGIGTTNPTYELSVNGGIRAKEVVVESAPWPDHVFTASHRNAPLSEVEQHISDHGHLPGVPSAADVAAKGINVGQMQAVLLEKIEELTLHMIAQEKRIQRLEAENVALRASH